MRRTFLRVLMIAALVAGGLGLGAGAAPAPALAAYGAVKWPATGVITSKVDDRCPGYDNHDGYDIAGNYRSVISAAYAGSVSYIGWDAAATGTSSSSHTPAAGAPSTATSTGSSPGCGWGSTSTVVTASATWVTPAGSRRPHRPLNGRGGARHDAGAARAGRIPG